MEWLMDMQTNLLLKTGPESFEIVEDLAAIFHPELFPKHEPRHFIKLPDE
jgi:hypothetical protein